METAYLTYWSGDTANASYAMEGYVFGHSKIPNGTFIRIAPIRRESPPGDYHLGGGFVDTLDTRFMLGPTGYYGVDQLILNKGYK